MRGPQNGQFFIWICVKKFAFLEFTKGSTSKRGADGSLLGYRRFDTSAGGCFERHKEAWNHPHAQDGCSVWTWGDQICMENFGNLYLPTDTLFLHIARKYEPSHGTARFANVHCVW